MYSTLATLTRIASSSGIIEYSSCCAWILQSVKRSFTRWGIRICQTRAIHETAILLVGLCDNFETVRLAERHHIGRLSRQRSAITL